VLRKCILQALCAAALTAFALFSVASSMANPPIWAKKGVSFRASCDADDRKECKPQRIASPDGKSAVEVSYNTIPDHPDIVLASLRVVSLGRARGEVQLVGSIEDEVTWSPDSKAFFINGNENADAWDLLAVHMLDDPQLGPGYIAHDVKQDTFRSLHPARSIHPPSMTALNSEPSHTTTSGSWGWTGSAIRRGWS
jgi:hypothetical protein